MSNENSRSSFRPSPSISPSVFIAPSLDALPSQKSTGGQHSASTSSRRDSTRIYDQRGSVILGLGSKKEAALLGLGLPRLSHRQHDDLARAKQYAMEQSIKHVLMKQQLAHQQMQQKMSMYAQALSLMSRVYVGSVSFELREEQIKNAFSPFGPIKSINMSYDQLTGHHKGFAFIEFEAPEAAALAQEQMNGVLMGGRNIKVGRPSNMPQAQAIIDQIQEEAKGCYRIYVSSIHPDLTEADVRSVFEAFGPIRHIEFARGPAPGKHRGYAYIDYSTEQAALDAVASMNLFDLGGQFLRVGRAITPPQMRDYMPSGSHSTLPTASAVAAAAVTAKLQALEATSAVKQPFAQGPPIVVAGRGSTPPASGAFVIPPPGVAIPRLPTPTGTPPSPSHSAGNYSPAMFATEFQQSTAAAAPVSIDNNVPTPPMDTQSPPPTSAINDIDMEKTEDNGDSTAETSRIIALYNMVGVEEVDETLEEEVAEECGKYGTVEQVIVNVDPRNQVGIYVKYSNKQEAEMAIKALDGRYFGGRRIVAVFYDEEMFNCKRFST